MPQDHIGPADGVSRRSLIAGGAAIAGGVLGLPFAARPARAASAADLVITNATVRTMDPGRPQATAVAISGGTIAYVGDGRGAAAFTGPRTEVIDAGGRMVMPGIHDGHAHPLGAGRNLTTPDLAYRKLTIAQFVAAIRGFVAASRRREPDQWLQVVNWDPTVMPKQPTRRDLDRLDTRRPIVVFDSNGHTALVNSRGLAVAGIDRSTPNPDGGVIVKDAHGEPTGILSDNAYLLVTKVIPKPTVDDDAASLDAAHREMLRQGITAYMTAAADDAELAALAALSDRGRLVIQPGAAIEVDADLAAKRADMFAFLADLKARHGRPDVRGGVVKMFFDGVAEYPTQTAAMLRPYRRNAGTKSAPRWVSSRNRGPTYYPPRTANPAVAALDAAGWQVHVHAIGDRAARSALDAFAHARTKNGPRGNRHTIAHLELVDPHDFPRFRQLGVLASMQLQWAERDAYTVDALRPYVGERRWRFLYPAGSLHRAGALLCGGSDWPVDPLLPFRAMEMAVNRTADEVYEGYPQPLRPRAEGISLALAARMHTRNAAFQLHLERRSGQIKRGMRGDVIVVDRDIFSVPLTRVSTARVLLTAVGGRIAHRAKALA